MNKEKFLHLFRFEDIRDFSFTKIQSITYTERHNITSMYRLGPMILTTGVIKPKPELVIEIFLYCKKHNIPVVGFEHNKHIKQILLAPMLEPIILKDKRYKDKNHPLSVLPTDVIRSLYNDYL
jgi:hypothetical protein